MKTNERMEPEGSAEGTTGTGGTTVTGGTTGTVGATDTLGATETVGTDGRRLTPGMRRVLGITGAVLAVVLAAAIWLLVAGGGPAATETQTDASDAAPGAGPEAAPGTAPGKAPGAVPGPVPGATPTTGSEVPDPDPAPSSRAETGLPPIPAPTPLVALPLPRSGSESGALVAGFPDTIVGPVPGSDVLESSIATEGRTMQVTLVARTDSSAEDVRAHYRDHWARLGLTESVGAAEGDVAFSDMHSSLSVAFTPASGTGTVYLVYGVLRAG